MPTSFFAKTLRRAVLRACLGAYPCVFVKWRVAFLGVMLVSFCVCWLPWFVYFYSRLFMVMLVVVW